MICHKCGYENKGGDKICLKCNALLDYHEIVAENIDTSGLALAKEKDEAEEVVKKPSSERSVMVVGLGILATLIVAAAIFVPQYLAQARAADILEVITAARSGVEAHVKERRVWPASEDDIELGLPADLLVDIDITIKRGVIKLAIPEEPGKTATLSPSVKSGRVVWECQNGGIGQDYLPLGCFK